MRLLECAKILTTHGIKGEVKIKIETDDISRFNKGNILYIENEKTPITIDNFRPFKNMGLLMFNNINNINDVLQYVGKSIYVDVDKDDDDSIYLDDLIGLKVIDKGNEIGEVVDILEVPQGQIIIIKHQSGKTSLVPNVDEFVKEINLEDNTLIIESIEGLLCE